MDSRSILQVCGCGGACAQALADGGGGCAPAGATARVRAALALAAAVFALALAFMLAPQSAWADSAFGGGSGTESDPYKITSATDLTQLATDVNGGEKYSGDYFVLTDDITIPSSTSWMPIDSSSSKYFAGTFDGDGHTISGLYIDAS